MPSSASKRKIGSANSPRSSLGASGRLVVCLDAPHSITLALKPSNLEKIDAQDEAVPTGSAVPPPAPFEAAVRKNPPQTLEATFKELDQAIVCPLTQDVYEEPVVAMDGFTYERSAIEAYFAHQRAAGQLLRSPMSRAVLESEVLVPNRSLKSIVALRRAMPENIETPAPAKLSRQNSDALLVAARATTPSVSRQGSLSVSRQGSLGPVQPAPLLPISRQPSATSGQHEIRSPSLVCDTPARPAVEETTEAAPFPVRAASAPVYTARLAHVREPTDGAPPERHNEAHNANSGFASRCRMQ